LRGIGLAAQLARFIIGSRTDLADRLGDDADVMTLA